MTAVTVRVGRIEQSQAQVIGLGLSDDWKRSGLPTAVRRILEAGAFHGKPKELVAMPTLGRFRGQWIIAVGLGKPGEVTAERIRQAAGMIVRTARDRKAQRIALCFPESRVAPEALGQGVAEGAWLGLYRFTAYKHVEDVKPDPKTVTLLVPTTSTLRAAAVGLRRGMVIAEAVRLARDLINQPSNVATPTFLANAARQAAKQARIRCTVLSAAKARQLGMGAFLSVAKGSAQPPQFIVLEYKPARAKATVVFAGKGITFDTGGISIKPSEGMDKMKYDMSGGAAVIGLLQAAARLKLPFHVVGLVAATENMPGGNASKPGDIVRAMNGKSIEILNTDAEGRLVLADALCYARRFKPDAVVDFATLTGACVVALGDQAMGMMGREKDAKLKERIQQAGESSGERVWELPLWDAYLDGTKSPIADVQNIGPRGQAGTIMGAAFLSFFAEGYPWVHLDIAGVAWAEKDLPYIPKGAAGVGVRLGIELLRQWAGE